MKSDQICERENDSTLKVEQDQIEYSLNKEDKTAAIIKCLKRVHEDIIIPRSVLYEGNEFIIVSINDESFYKSRIKSIKFAPDSELQTIGTRAFDKSFIESVSLPSSLKKIGSYAFVQCRHLHTVEIPLNSELQSIENCAFGKSSIEQIYIPPHVTEISSCTFISCTKLRHIEIPSNSQLQIIKQRAFYRSSIEGILLPNGVYKLEDSWCSNAPKLNEITIMPNNQSFKLIDDNFVVTKSDPKSDIYDVLIFAKKTLKTVTIPSYIKQIGFSAFEDSSVERVILSSQITEIGQYAFSYCLNLRYLEIPHDSKLQVIGKYAFDNSSIEKIFIPKNVTKIDEYAFRKCENLTNIEFANDSQLQTIEMGAFSKSSIENIIIPSCVKQVCKSSFRKCKKLINISIHPSMFQFLDWSNGLPKTTKITIMSDNEYIRNLSDDVIIGKSDMQSDIYDNLVFVTRNMSTFTIPSFINKIATYAFAESTLSYIKIPSNVTQIDDYAFSNCEQLSNIEFSHDSQLKIIGKSAFYGSFITHICIPCQVSQICENAFEGCIKLTQIDICQNSKLEIIGKNAFSGTAISDIFIPSHIKSISEDAFSCCWNLQNIEFDENTKEISFEKQNFHNKSMCLFIPPNLKTKSFDSLTIESHKDYPTFHLTSFYVKVPHFRG